MDFILNNWNWILSLAGGFLSGILTGYGILDKRLRKVEMRLTRLEGMLLNGPVWYNELRDLMVNQGVNDGKEKKMG